MKLALIIGRFQPLHNGHLALIAEARKQADQTLVLIGSSKQLPDFKNPFSYEERLGLLTQCLPRGEDLSVYGLPDQHDDDEWIQEVVARVNQLEEDPTEVAVFCGQKDEEFYRKSFLYPVINVDKEICCSATAVRTAWYDNTLWTVEEFIPEVTKKFLENHKDHDRLSVEYSTTTESAQQKKEGHPFGNPVEVVSFAVIVKDTKVLLGKRGGPRGDGQWGLPGGFIHHDENTLDGCLRETHEEMGFNLKELIVSNCAQCFAQSVEENLDNLGTRNIGINYLFVIKPEHELEVKVDQVETTDYKWVPLKEILEDSFLLFYNHNLVVKRLISKIGGNKDD